MKHEPTPAPEIESFNLLELDVSALDVRLELTTLMPKIFPFCTVRCDANLGGTCHTHG